MIFISISTQLESSRRYGSCSPQTHPHPFLIQVFLIGVNRSKSATSLSDFGHTWDQTFSPETRSDHMFAHVHLHCTSEFFYRAVLYRSTSTQLMPWHVFTRSDPKMYSFRKLITKFFGYWFFQQKSLKVPLSTVHVEIVWWLY